jgi:hypothetical protein
MSSMRRYSVEMLRAWAMRMTAGDGAIFYVPGTRKSRILDIMVED